MIFAVFQYFLIQVTQSVDNSLEAVELIVYGVHWHAGAEIHPTRIYFGPFAMEKCGTVEGGRNFGL
jgi:hypothetical protein